MEKLDEDAVRGRLREVFPKLVVSGMDVCMGMSALWHLRKLGSRKFADVVQVEASLPVEWAELLARSWEVSRRNRDLRELCMGRPWELVETVSASAWKRFVLSEDFGEESWTLGRDTLNRS